VENTARSHDHAFLGTVDDWLYQRVAGIEPAAPGYAKITIQPYPVGDLTNAAAHVDSPLGQVSSTWTRKGGRFTLRAGVPAGATAEILVPATSRAAVNAPRTPPSPACATATPRSRSARAATCSPRPCERGRHPACPAGPTGGRRREPGLLDRRARR